MLKNCPSIVRKHNLPFLMILVIVFAHRSQAQTVLEIDSVTRMIKTPIPFDQNLTLKLADPEGALDSAFIFKLYMKGGELSDTKHRLFKKDKTGPQLFKIGAKQIGKNSYVEVPALNPDLHFEIILDYKFKGAALKEMMQVVHYFVSDRAKALQLLNQLSSKLEPLLKDRGERTAIGKYWLAEIAYTHGPTNIQRTFNNTVSDFFINRIVPLYQVVTNHSYDMATGHLNETNFALATSQLASKDDKFDGFASLSRALNGNPRLALLNGKSSLAFVTQTDKEYDLAKRASNLKASIKSLELAIQKTYLLLLYDPGNKATYDNMIADLAALSAKLEANSKVISDQRAAIENALSEEKNMRYTVWATGTNEVRNLETLGSYLIIPNIGLTTVVTPDGYDDFYRPFLGVSIHLRQVNKNVPLRELKNRALHRLAFQLGVTVGGISDENKEYFDLTEKLSIMGGANFKITHAFGISAGCVLMKRADPNPLIVQRQTVINPYIALSLDVDFAKALKTLQGKFGL